MTALDFGASASAIVGLGEVEPGLGHADQLHGLGGGDRGRQRGRVGQADVLAGQDHQPPRDEARVLARLDHPGQVVQRGVDVGAADRLDEGADHVVVLVALPVVADRGLVDGASRRLEVDRRRSRRDGRAGGRLEEVSARGRHRRRAGPGGPARRRRASTARQAALVGRAPGRSAPAMSSSVSGSRVSSRVRESSGEITEKNGFSVVAAIRVTQRFSTPGSSASCCALVKRCTSSTNSTVSWPPGDQLARGAVDDRAHLLDPGGDRGELDEPAVGLRRRSRRSSSCRCRAAPEQQRHRRSASTSRRSGEPGGEQVLLADDLVERARPHPHRERRGGVHDGASGRRRTAPVGARSRPVPQRCRSRPTTAS